MQIRTFAADWELAGVVVEDRGYWAQLCRVPRASPRVDGDDADHPLYH
jgi:hypothetical protein